MGPEDEMRNLTITIEPLAWEIIPFVDIVRNYGSKTGKITYMNVKFLCIRVRYMIP